MSLNVRAVLALLVAVALGAALVSCSSDTKPSAKGGSLDIIAATELRDLEPLMEEASSDLGFDITMSFPGGTIENSRRLADGGIEGVDATWFATNRYVDLFSASDKLSSSTEIAKSPVAFGVWSDKARELGWDKKQPTWDEFAQAAKDGKFTFGMTDPATSNSGFSALVSVATAMADTGEALSQQDISMLEDRLPDLFQAQTMVSGSSGWLVEAFVDDPDKADAIINYESVLLEMNKNGATNGRKMTVVVPSDGVISADYPLSALAAPTNDGAKEKVQALSEWLLDHQQDIADTSRRPVKDVDNLPAELSSQTVIELPFPANLDVLNSLLDAYNNEYRAAGATTFIMDTSGSMEGERMVSLKQIMNSLIDGTANTAIGNVGLRNHEKVTLQAFSTTPLPSVTEEFDRNSAEVKGSLHNYINDLRPDGKTAIYDTLMQTIERTDADSGIPSIVLLTDGEVTNGMDYHAFERAYRDLSVEKRKIPVFVILYGEASESEMNALAELTGGKVFDALNGDLAEAFKEIRGYQ
ncbi:VWA domain-containing protein [Corynebacterium aquatimens]